VKKISIITPVYYNAESLPLHVEAVRDQRDILKQRFNLDLELIYVNDGSKDNSLEVLKKIKSSYPEWVSVINLSRNFGSLRAIKAGFNHATGDCATYLSADLQDPASLIVEMAEKWLDGSNYVICIRENRKDPLSSVLFANLFYLLTRQMISSSYPKGGFDMFLLGSDHLDYIRKCGKNYNIMLFSHWLGLEPAKIYYTRRERMHGKSRWTFRKKFNLVIDSFLGFSTAPVKIASVLGIGTSILSFLYGLYTLVLAIMGGIPVPGYASIICLISFLLGLVVLILGIIAEYLARVYDEVTNKPEYIIENIL